MHRGSEGCSCPPSTCFVPFQDAGRLLLRSTPCPAACPDQNCAHLQIVELMGQEKGWWWARRRAELARAREYLATFHSRPVKTGPIDIGESPSAA